MRKLPILMGAALLAAAVLPAGVSAHSASSSVKLHATLTGKTEVPPPGSAHGKGTATVTLDVTKQIVCFSISVSGIKLPAAAAHIHSGRAGKMGPVVVPFTAPAKNGRSVGCVHKVRAALIKGIENHPSSYYVNVHTTDFPGGAVRGQLG